MMSERHDFEATQPSRNTPYSVAKTRIGFAERTKHWTESPTLLETREMIACVPWRNNFTPIRGVEFSHSRRQPTLCHVATGVTSSITLDHPLPGSTKSVILLVGFSLTRRAPWAQQTQFPMTGLPISPHPQTPHRESCSIERLRFPPRCLTPRTHDMTGEQSFVLHRAPTVGLSSALTSDFPKFPL